MPGPISPTVPPATSPRAPRRRCPWARGEAEGVRVNEADALDDVDGLGELRIGLAGEADDDVGGDRRAIERVSHAIDRAQEIVARVLAVHAMEEVIGATLKWKMKMWNDLRVGAKMVDQVVRQIAGLQTAK